MPEIDWQDRNRNNPREPVEWDNRVPVERQPIDRWNPRDDYDDDVWNNNDRWNELPQRHPRDPVYLPREPIFRPERDPREPDFLPPRDNRQPIYQPVGQDDVRGSGRRDSQRRDDDWDLRRDPRELDFFDSPRDELRDPNFRMPPRDDFPVRSPRL